MDFKMNKRIQVVDCTLRDGGFALEDAQISAKSTLIFGQENIDAIFQELIASDIDIIEFGSIETSDTDKRNIAIYPTLENISSLIPQKKNNGQQYAALYRGPDCPTESIPSFNETRCDIVRVIIRYSELQKSMDFCKALSLKGYKVCIQPMVTMRYNEDEIQILLDAANDMGAYALYFVDSYGYMRERDVTHYFTRFDADLDDSIRIGFHAHNNLNLAFANALAFIGQNSDRKIIVDSCILGMGQGAGNLQTELFVDHMNKYCGAAYNYDSILRACEIVEKFYGRNLWGYSVTRLLPAINKAAYKFSVALRNTYELSFVDIHHILSNIPEDLRHRYTQDNTRKLLALFGYDETGKRRYDDESI
jgi:4-hydroxy 2-oxovalerate aldolase